jgi:hypothetical protein
MAGAAPGGRQRSRLAQLEAENLELRSRLGMALRPKHGHEGLLDTIEQHADSLGQWQRRCSIPLVSLVRGLVAEVAMLQASEPPAKPTHSKAWGRARQAANGPSNGSPGWAAWSGSLSASSSSSSSCSSSSADLSPWADQQRHSRQQGGHAAHGGSPRPPATRSPQPALRPGGLLQPWPGGLESPAAPHQAARSTHRHAEEPHTAAARAPAPAPAPAAAAAAASLASHCTPQPPYPAASPSRPSAFPLPSAWHGTASPAATPGAWSVFTNPIAAAEGAGR